MVERIRKTMNWKENDRISEFYASFALAVEAENWLHEADGSLEITHCAAGFLM
jgi:hypothetical protein